MSEKEYDLFVIGNGSAGEAAISTAVGIGAKVATAEKEFLGGDCPNIACVPTKALLRSGEIFRLIKNAQEFGLDVGNVSFDWPRILARKEKVVARQNEGAKERLKEEGVDLFWGEAVFQDKNTVKVGNEVIKAKNILIAAGSDPAIPPIPGLPETGFITSDQAVSIPQLPKSIIIVGAGAVGIEFSQLFSRFGVAVSLVEGFDRIMPPADSEISAALKEHLEGEGVKVYTSAKVAGFKKVGTEKVASVDIGGQQQEIKAEEVFIATGRKPDFAKLNLEATGVQTDKKGVIVDDFLRTNVPNIYAAGDITGKMLFTHTATYQGTVAAYNALSGKEYKASYDAVPWIAFSDPPVAGVGQTEDKCKEVGIKYNVGKWEYKTLGMARILGEEKGFVKILAGEDETILGGHIFGSQAGELIHEVSLMMHVGAKVSSFGNAIFAFPSLSEVVGSAASSI